MGKIQRILFLLILIAVVLLPSCKTKEVANISPAYNTRHVNNLDAGFQGTGVFYNLPRTTVVVDIEVKKTTKTPGPYAGYASRFLGLDDIITASQDIYYINHVSISSFTEPDPEQIYFVSFPDQQQQNLYIRLNEAGLIHSFNSKFNELEKQRVDDLVKYPGYLFDDDTFNFIVDADQTGGHESQSEIYGDDNIAVQRQTLRRSWVEKSTELRAREVADYILEIREKKFDLISGFQEIPYSKEALKYMYDEMNKLENDYLDLFTGITSHDILKYRYIIRPSKNDIEKENALFRFSPHNGIMSLASEEGVIAGLKYSPIKATLLADMQISNHASTDQKDSLGFHYRIPEHTDISLLLGDEIRAQTRMLVNQFGIVSYLPAKNMSIEFHPQTGAIKSIGINE